MAAKPCPRDPPPHPGYQYWRGPVPAELGAWAREDLKVEAGVAYGYEWTKEYQGELVIARKDHHTWTYRGGKLVTGICIPGITLYRPIVKADGEPPPPTVDPTVPDPELAWYDDGPGGIAWAPVLVTAGAIAIVVTGFLLALKYAGR